MTSNGSTDNAVILAIEDVFQFDDAINERCFLVV